MTDIALGRRVLAEGVGTAFLSMAVIGSGIAAARLSPDDVGLQLLENSIATGAVLVALILAFGSVSSAFNPVVTLLDAALGKMTWTWAAGLVVAQVVGAIAGAVLANVMFGLDAVSMAGHARSGGDLWVAEVVATVGLLLVIVGCRDEVVAYAVGGYIAAAYWFTSSTSFANPAMTVGRMFSDTFAGIAPHSVPMFVVMQIAGGVVAFALIRLMWPRLAL